METLRSRIVGEADVDPSDLLANPLNWRTHPKSQVDALEGLLKDVGWVQRVIVNQRTGHVVDGHARVELALRRSEPSVPVLYVDLSEREEALVLATLDPIGGLAGVDAARLDELLRDVSTGEAALQELLSKIATDNGLAAVKDLEPPEDFPELDESIPTEHECPKCGYRWSGKSG